MDIDQFGTASPFNWSQDHLLNVLIGGSKPIVSDPIIINAFKNIKREDFVREDQKDLAYKDQGLDLNDDEHLDQPTSIAKMIQLLRPVPGKKYLDIGSGSGYVACLLGSIAGEGGKVYSLERDQFLADFARNNVAKYPKLANIVEILFKDGSQGLADKAPFDFIHSSVAFPKVPNEIKNQLVVKGRMVMPVASNQLYVIERLSPTEFAESVQDGFFVDQVREGIR